MESYYDYFPAALEGRYPDKTSLVNALADLLCLEKESVYRRLRKNVNFTAEEMLRIAAAWNISLDNIVSANPRKTASFNLKTVNFVNPQEEDYAILEQHNRDLELVADDPNGMGVEIVNALPRGLYGRSEHLTRFFTMKWYHKFAPKERLTFGEITIPERLRKLDLEYISIEHRFAEMHSVHDPRLFENLVNDMIYYRSIGMLTAGDTALLRDELLVLIDYLENVTLTGYFPNAKNKIFFYLSHSWIETEYLLYKSEQFNLSLIKILERNSIASLDKSVLDRFMNMAKAAESMSVLMSGSNALQQTEFFSRQREFIMTL